MAPKRESSAGESRAATDPARTVRGAARGATDPARTVRGAARGATDPARVLLLHNRYRAAGGEEAVVDQLDGLLRARGHAVARFERDSSDVGAGRAAAGLLRGGLDPGEVARAVRAHRAEIVHAHNVHPLLGWRALAAAREAGARVVLHLHNYRLVCAIGLAFRDGAPCARCQGRDTRPGVRLRCRGSLPEAVVYGAGLTLQQPRLLACSDAVVLVSEGQRAHLAALGCSVPDAAVLLNAAPRLAAESVAADGAYALVAGRLVQEKGVDVAVRAARAAGVPLLVAGEGEEEAALRGLAGAAGGGLRGAAARGGGAAVGGGAGAGGTGPDAGGEAGVAGPDGVRFLGRLTPDELARVRRGAAVLLAPSRAQDPCPMSVVEALADGVPVLASDRGGLPELVGPGAALAVDDVAGWAAALRALWEDRALRARRGAEALARARSQHAPDIYYERLTRVYARALA